MMRQSQGTGACQLAHLRGILAGAVAPADPRAVLLRRELRIVNDEIGSPQELDMAEILARHPPPTSCQFPRMWLMIDA